jgi:hypothetical protein
MRTLPVLSPIHLEQHHEWYVAERMREAESERLARQLSRAASREAAYRRLALAILGLDVTTLALGLRAARGSRSSG